MIHRIRYYSKKVYELGFFKTFLIVYTRIARFFFYYYWKQKAIHRHACHGWQNISQKYQNTQFEFFFDALRTRMVFLRCHSKAFSSDKETIIALAHQYCAKGFDLLGSGLMYFKKMPWHVDFRLQKQVPGSDCFFDETTFFQDIKIEVGMHDALIKDIKVPWELSRFQHAVILGLAYHYTENAVYVHAFVEQTSDWLDKNPYLLGINWLCPMEVAIRALNLVIALSLFCDAPSVSHDFWQRLICALYDHLIYLEHNWEIYDFCTSNHYLSNLIGYFYLIFLFQDLSGFDAKRDWVIKELQAECEKQIFNEGTDYEGSTYYHRLITELFIHVSFMCEMFNLPLSAYFKKKIVHMCVFSDWCTPIGGKLIQIGDNDSGTITHPLVAQKMLNAMVRQQKDGCIHFQSFGLSVIKTSVWHVTLRHHAYQKRQPSGHMHNDVGSITLAIDGIPIFIDPGSFVYTPSIKWRNNFRSVTAHNTFFIHGQEPVPFNDQLFFLPIPESLRLTQTAVDRTGTIMNMNHRLYYDVGATRIIRLGHNEQCVTIEDSWQIDVQTERNTAFKGCWSFILDPMIDVAYHDNDVILKYKNKPIIRMRSDLRFDIVDTWVSPYYGCKMRSKKVCAYAPLISLRTIKTHIFRIF